MTKEEFDSLNDADRALATDAYLDGFQAAVDSIDSIVQRIGDEDVDTMFESAQKSISHILKTNLHRLRASADRSPNGALRSR